MKRFDNLKMYARLVAGLARFLRRRTTFSEAEAVVRERMAQRERNFLRLLERGIRGHRPSPYRQLLRWAGVTFGDIERMLPARGLEGTLRALREAGVYLSFEEFKGRTPIVRGGRTLAVSDHDFDNPFSKRQYYTRTGGSTGPGTRIPQDFDHIAARVPYYLLADHAHGVLGAPVAVWYPIMPAGSGIGQVLARARMGNSARKWYTPVAGRHIKPPLRFRLATWYPLVFARLMGVGVPFPELLPVDRAVVLARWAAENARLAGRCIVRSTVSNAMRVSLAAAAEGLDLTGVCFVAGGEPLTPAKRETIVATGGQAVPGYFFSETGAVGWGCANPADSSDIHFFKDSLALIQHPRRVPGADATVNAFLFTTLLPTAPKLMLNVESDDFGIVEERRCGCALEAYGFTTHLREVRSFRKLTGEGVTLIGSEMERILEQVLPGRFGGSAIDYQLLEEEDAAGFTRLSLVVDPGVGRLDEKAVVDTVLEAIRRGGDSGAITGEQWRRGDTLRVRRMAPILTGRGKHLPLHVLRSPQRR